jgi:heme-degrading monooxygenase HmoA
MVVDHVTYRVRAGKEQDFEKLQDDWQRLLRRARGFITRILMRNAEDPVEYHAEVRWVSREYRDRFAAQKDSDRLQEKGASVLEGSPVHSLLEHL